jgi:hypothetical protein
VVCSTTTTDSDRVKIKHIALCRDALSQPDVNLGRSIVEHQIGHSNLARVVETCSTNDRRGRCCAVQDVLKLDEGARLSRGEHISEAFSARSIHFDITNNSRTH